MVRCSVIGCKSDNRRKITGLSFHSFPDDDQNLRKIWINATGRIDWVPNPSSKICSEHFDRTFIWKKGRTTLLNPLAVPKKLSDSESLHVDEPTHSSSSVLTIKAEDSETVNKVNSHTVWLTDSESLHVNEPTCSSFSVSSIKVEDSETINEEIARSNATISVASVTNTEYRHAINVPERCEAVKASSSPDYSPRTLKRKWKSAQQVSEQRLKKLKALREKTRRLTKKVAELENIIYELKS